MSCNLKVQVVSSCTERNPIGRRTQPNRTANAIQSDGERNPIRRRTQSNQTANAVRPQATNIHRLNEAIIKMLKR